MIIRKAAVGDVIINILILSLCIVCYAALRFGAHESKEIVVYTGTQAVCRLPLDRDAEFTPDGGHTVVTVKDKRAYISYSDCPDGLCMKMKPVSSDGGSVVCLPNRVSVSLAGAKDGDGGADYAAG